jgi:hypothetical protein
MPAATLKTRKFSDSIYEISKQTLYKKEISSQTHSLTSYSKLKLKKLEPA